MLHRTIRVSFTFPLFAALILLGALPLEAQEQGGGLFVVNYLEVGYGQSAQAAELLRRQRESGRAAPGNLRYEVLQRIARPNQFVILERWETPAAAQAHAESSATGRFLDALAPLQISPLDRREHHALAVAPDDPGNGTVYAVTHVDIVPNLRDTGVALLAELAGAGRADPGNIRFNVLVQSSRGNHLTVVEVWENQAVLESHAMSDHKKHFRNELAPLSGSLYDERIYRPLR